MYGTPPEEPQEKETKIIREVRERVSYESILLTALRDAYFVLARGGNGIEAINSFWSILTPDLQEALSDARKRFIRRLNEANKWFNEATASDFQYLGSKKVLSAQRSEHYQQCLSELKQKQHFACLEFLSEIVRVLDEAGMLRRYRREEVGEY